MQMTYFLFLLLLVTLSYMKISPFQTQIHFLKDFIDKMDRDNIMIIADGNKGNTELMILLAVQFYIRASKY